MRVLMILVLAFILAACSQETSESESKNETKVITEDDLIREAEEILNSDDEKYWDFSDPKTNTGTEN